VKTEKLVREREARRALLGKYRNKYTDAVEFQIRTTANTNILFHAGVMLACKEDGPPYALDPDTLDTIGVWDFDGQLESATFSAHPKFDPHTGDMLTFGYEAKGEDVKVSALVRSFGGKKTPLTSDVNSGLKLQTASWDTFRPRMRPRTGKS
jgi:carotenoid cleavage dioxygenase-like enzyme